LALPFQAADNGRLDEPIHDCIEECIGDCDRAMTPEPAHRTANPPQQTQTMSVPKATMPVEFGIRERKIVLFGEAPHAGFHPRIAEPQKEIGQVVPRVRRWREMGNHRSGFDINRPAGVRNRKAKVDVVQEGNELFVEETDTIEHFRKHEHAVEFDQCRPFTHQLIVDTLDGHVAEAMLLVQPAHRPVLNDAKIGACHVDDSPFGLAD
jgi:hypothetical protein